MTVLSWDIPVNMAADGFAGLSLERSEMAKAKRQKTPFGGKDGQYPSDMDKDMIPICDALNSLPGVRTFFCCSGHGRGYEGEFYICMGCSSTPSMKRILRAFDHEVNDSSYNVEVDHLFWPLEDDEVCVRVSNPQVDHLKAKARREELKAVIDKLAV